MSMLSNAQVRTIGYLKGKRYVDINDLHTATLSSLIVKQIIEVDYAYKPGQITTVCLTEVGKIVAKYIKGYRIPIDYNSVRIDISNEKASQYLDPME